MTARAATYQSRLRVLSAVAFGAAAAAWANVDAENAVPTWAAALPGVIAAVTAGQIAAARLASPYVNDIAGEQPGGAVNPFAFGGVASNGLPLASVLFSPALVLIRALRTGESPTRGRAAGHGLLDLLVRTQVTDAGRIATGVAMTAHPRIAGYERVVRLPACSRCIVLAGRVYRWNDGFRRHSRCDCTMRPVTREQFRTRNLDNHPRALFDRMEKEEQDKRFGQAGAEAIREGADISQVVNARRGMVTASVGDLRVKTTTSGTTRRAAAGRRLAGKPRLMPEAIYQLAEDRDDAIRLLRLHGYIL